MTMSQTKSTAAETPVTPRRRITMERVYNAPIEEVWELWTTKEGIESWWGPDGFKTTVRAIDLRVGGELRYAFTAVAKEQIAFMEKAGMPTTTESRVRYTEVSPPNRLRYTHLADFIPGVAPYNVDTVVELTQTAQGVRMTLTFDAMHDEHWTEMAVKGWTMELEKLAKLLAA